MDTLTQPQLPISSVSWLSPRWFVFGAKKGILHFDGQTISFTEDSGLFRFTYAVTDIQHAGFKASGWVFLKTKNGKIHKVAFFKPTTSSKEAMDTAGVLSGQLGVAVTTLQKVNTGDSTAQQWQLILQPYILN